MLYGNCEIDPYDVSMYETITGNNYPKQDLTVIPLYGLVCSQKFLVNLSRRSTIHQNCTVRRWSGIVGREEQDEFRRPKVRC